MKVTVIWDFSVKEIEDFSQDKVEIKMSYEEFSQIRKFLDETWMQEIGSEVSKKARLLRECLDDYDTKSIG